MHSHHGFTLPELGVLLIVLLVAAVALMPSCDIGPSRRASNKMRDMTQLTAMVKNMVLWSDAFYTKDQEFPRAGLPPLPPTVPPYTIASNSPTDRVAALCNMGSDPLSPMLLVNPVGTDTPATGTAPTIVLHSNNLSYALLDAQNVEWKNKVNSSAPLAADKQVGKGTFWNSRNWEGGVVWGDSHVSWESGETSATWPTTTINGNTTTHDNLFAGTTGETATDAVLINP